MQLYLICILIKRFTKLSFFFLIFPSIAIFAQDTLKVMDYNLLFYGNTGPTPCSLLTPAQKNPKLVQILNYIKPDILGVNELGNDDLYAQNILANTLNVNGTTKYKRATYSNTKSQGIVNTIFYNSDKLALKSQKVVCNLLRDISSYKLYYNHPSIATTLDTTFLYVLVAHLKAGDSQSDQNTRASETILVRDYLNTLPANQNVIMMGDFNIQSSSETSYQHLINQTINPDRRLIDPISLPGSWNNNSGFAQVHTQSTRSSSSCDGGVPGGLDDRLDFILCSKAIKDDSSRVKYIPGTYKAIGQDGLHFNGALTDAPLNSTVPQAVLSALFGMSDHLPVIAQFEIRRAIPSGIPNQEELSNSIYIQNPFNNEIRIWSKDNYLKGKVNLSLYSLDGKLLLENDVNNFESGNIMTPDFNLNSGMYLLVITPENGIRIIKKLVKQIN